MHTLRDILLMAYMVFIVASVIDSFSYRFDRKDGLAPLASAIYSDMRPLMPPTAFFISISYFWDGNFFSAGLWLFNGFVVAIFYRKGDDDDRWKRRRKKALAKVKAIGGKLVVVPEVSPSRA